MSDENAENKPVLIDVMLTQEHEHNGVLYPKGTTLSVSEADAAFIVDTAKAGQAV